MESIDRLCRYTIPHEPLIDRVARRISDGKVLELIRRFLTSGVMEEMTVRLETTGRPQGGIVTPVLAGVQRGWFYFFREGNTYGRFKDLDAWVRRRLRSLLRKRTKRRGISPRGSDHQRWPNAYFAQRGFFSMQDHLTDYRRPADHPGLFPQGI